MLIIFCILINWMLIGSLGAITSISQFKQDMSLKDYFMIWTIAFTIGPILLTNVLIQHIRRK
jgi:hypothetical protein